MVRSAFCDASCISLLFFLLKSENNCFSFNLFVSRQHTTTVERNELNLTNTLTENIQHALHQCCFLHSRGTGEQCWHSVESTRLPPMWPGFHSRIHTVHTDRIHKWGPRNYSFVFMLIILSSLTLEKNFF